MNNYLWIVAGVFLIAYLIYSDYKKKKSQSKQETTPNKKSNNKKTYIIVAILCIATMAGYYVYHNHQQVESNYISLSEATKLSQNDTFSGMVINTSEYKFSYLELTIADNISESIITKDINDKDIALEKNDIVKVDTGTLDIIGLKNSGFKLPPEYSQEQYKEPFDWIGLFSPIIMLVLFIGLYYWMYGGFGSKQEKLFKREKNDVRFEDIGGLTEIKEQLKEVIGFINDKTYYEKIGARIPKGIILEGAPGVGKTMLAKAIATEANVPFYYTSGSEFHTMWVGMSSQRIKSLFKRASKTNSIVFIDEFDSIAGRRTNLGTDVSREWGHTLNQLLTEMDGFKANTKIMVIAATNRVDVLDPAVLRAGRFDYKINVPMPNYNDRREILKIYMKNKNIDKDVSINSIAKQTANFSGADLDLLVNEAAIMSGKEHNEIINMVHFTKAIDKIMVGEERKNYSQTEKEKKIIAYHEASHGVIANLMSDGEKVEKISILQHTKSGGFTRMSQEIETTVLSKSQILRNITILLGGRVGEEMLSEDITNGASDDLRKANELAREMVEHFGMSDKFGLRYALQNSMGISIVSNDTAKLIDEDINTILVECHSEAMKVIKNNQVILDKVANKLLEVETLSGDELKELMVG